MQTAPPLRLMVFDRTCVGKKVPFGLSTAWSSGSSIYRGLGRLDATFGASSWQEALDWLTTFEAERPIQEIQYWGHGNWGKVLIDRDKLDASALRDPNHALHSSLMKVRDRLSDDALVWFRTCEAFGGEPGHDFAESLANGLNTKVAGHTFIIGALQSGLRALLPGHRPRWSATEGIKEGTASDPKKAKHSIPGRPRTVTCFTNTIPEQWFEEDSG
jgi:hypothetical protein